MTRDELILSCQGTVRNLVRKYNNHKIDEDLEAVGLIAVIECVDRSLSEGLTDIDQVQARCNTWARNAILREIYKEKIKLEDNSVLEGLKAEDDWWETIVDVKKCFTLNELQIFESLLEGGSKDEILAKFRIKPRTYFHHLAKIKEKIKNSHCSFEGL